MPEANRHHARLTALLVAGLIALNFPLLSLFSKVTLVFGIPLLYLYIFAVWCMFIVCVALILAPPPSPPVMNSPSKTEQPE
jgi:hypothetical protein